MASINTISAFANATAPVAGIFNNKYDLLYNELNGNLDNANFATTAGIVESKVQFAGSGHDHSSGKALTLSSISTVGAKKGQIIYYTGTTWARFGTGTVGQKLKFDFDTSTKLALHFDNNVVDSCSTPKTVTNSGVTFSSSIYKYGGYSALFSSASSSYLSLSDSADWAWGTSAFTIDCWIYPNSTTTTTICGQSISGFQYQVIQIEGSNFYFASALSDSPSTKVVQFFSNAGFIAENWYHIAVVREAGAITEAGWHMFVNGVEKTKTLDGGSYNCTLSNLSDNFEIGRASGFVQHFDGYIDEFIITKGTARWTANFTTSSTAYTPDLLWA